MTGLDLVAVQDLILAHVESSFPAYEVKEDQVLDDEIIVKLNNRLKPYIVLRWHGLNRSVNNASFAGVRYDEYSSSVDVILVAPSPRQARLGLNMVMDELIGWQVPGGSPLTPTGGQALFSVSEYEGKPHVYMAMNNLSFQVNSTDVGS